MARGALILSSLILRLAATILYTPDNTNTGQQRLPSNPSFAASLPMPTATAVIDPTLVAPYAKVGELLSPLPIPPLEGIAPAGDVGDVVSYYQAHVGELASMFDDGERAPAFFAMYIVHLAKPYRESTAADNLVDFMALARAHCGIYAPVQQEISQALGLSTRYIAFTNGFHGWIEVEILGHWEIFDSTTNVWIDHSMEELLGGVTRRYRMFYTPALDEMAPETYRAHLKEWYNAPALRARLPFFGLEPWTTYPPLVSMNTQ